MPKAKAATGLTKTKTRTGKVFTKTFYTYLTPVNDKFVRSKAKTWGNKTKFINALLDKVRSGTVTRKHL